MVGHILWQMFNWPSGNVLGNLIASLVWAVATGIALRLMHKRLKNHIDNSLQDQDERTDTKLQEHHQKVIDHINSKMDAPVVEVRVDQNG